VNFALRHTHPAIFDSESRPKLRQSFVASVRTIPKDIIPLSIGLDEEDESWTSLFFDQNVPIWQRQNAAVAI
jgi:hypothetical protein